MAAYARQRSDLEIETWCAEIKLRACIRIGELVGELETSPGRPSVIPPSGGKNFKADAIADAGLSQSDAYRCRMNRRTACSVTFRDVVQLRTVLGVTPGGEDVTLI